MADETRAARQEIAGEEVDGPAKGRTSAAEAAGLPGSGKQSQETAGAFALRTLRELSEEEMLVEGLWQLAGGAFSRSALRQALHRLHKKGLVSRDRDVHRETWWAITKAGLA